MPRAAPSESRGVRATLAYARGTFRFSAALELPARGVTALFGRSGSGKTTCLRLLAGLLRGRGSVHVGAECWQDDARRVFVPVHRRALGFVFQDHVLLSHLDVAGNLAYGARRSRGRAILDPEKVFDLLGIRPLLTRHPNRLSGGELKRAAIAQALLSQPRVLMMDEPLSGVDSAHKAEILGYLERLRDALPIPILYVSHAMDEVARLADHAVVFDRGSGVAAGPISDVFARPELAAFFGAEAGVVLEAVVASHDATYNLTELSFDGGKLWVSRVDKAPGERVRARALARDVSLALTPPGPTSILNVLQASVVEVREESADAVLVRMTLGSGPALLLARVTRRSVALLGLEPGKRVHAQIKSVAISA